MANDLALQLKSSCHKPQTTNHTTTLQLYSTHPLTDSLTRSLTHPLNHSITESLSKSHNQTHYKWTCVLSFVTTHDRTTKYALIHHHILITCLACLACNICRPTSHFSPLSCNDLTLGEDGRHSASQARKLWFDKFYLCILSFLSHTWLATSRSL